MNWKLFAVMAAAGSLLAGCISVDYVGQKFEPLSDSASVKLYKTQIKYPADQYKVIGHATFTAPDTYSSVDMWDKVLETAREYGADAVKIVSAEKVLTSSIYRQPEEGRQLSSGSSNSNGTAADGSQINYNTFGDQVKGNSARVDSYEVVVKALMLVDVKKFDEVMARRRIERTVVQKEQQEAREKAAAPAAPAAPAERPSAERSVQDVKPADKP